MSELIDFCFDGGGNIYVAVTKYGARWNSDPSACWIILITNPFKTLLNIY